MLTRKVNKIIIHCSATKEAQDFSASDIKEWHLDRGFRDIGYHYVIKLDGKIEYGRNIDQQGAHCRGENEHSIGICYIGGLDKDGKPKDTRTKEQKESLLDLIHSLNQCILNWSLVIQGHNQFSNKSCPCFDVEKEYGKNKA